MEIHTKIETKSIRICQAKSSNKMSQMQKQKFSASPQKIPKSSKNPQKIGKSTENPLTSKKSSENSLNPLLDPLENPFSHQKVLITSYEDEITQYGRVGLEM